jgi:hypothetical protein
MNLLQILLQLYSIQDYFVSILTNTFQERLEHVHKNMTVPL